MRNTNEKLITVKPWMAAGCFMLCVAPVAFGQLSQAGSSSTAAAPVEGQTQAQAQTQNQTQTKAASEPQMVDQSAPREQSLGAVARQAKAQKPKTETTKVYTEDKLSGLSGHGVSLVGSGS